MKNGITCLFANNGAPCLLLMVLSALLSGCVSMPNSQGVATKSIDPGVPGPVAGVGIESHDIVAMTERMTRDMLSNATLAGRATSPRVIVDSKEFTNDSAQAINKNIIVDRLRVNLNRAAQGRLVFVGREYAKMIEDERNLKRQGITDVGTTGMTKAQAGVDFRLGGRITFSEARNSKTGMIQRLNQIVFEMVDLESGVIVWNGIYDFERAGADDVVYR